MCTLVQRSYRDASPCCLAQLAQLQHVHALGQRLREDPELHPARVVHTVQLPRAHALHERFKAYHQGTAVHHVQSELSDAAIRCRLCNVALGMSSMTRARSCSDGAADIDTSIDD